MLVHDVCKREIGSREEFIEDDYDYGQSESSVRFFLDKLSNSSNNNVIHPDIGISSFPFYCEIVDEKGYYSCDEKQAFDGKRIL